MISPFGSLSAQQQQPMNYAPNLGYQMQGPQQAAQFQPVGNPQGQQTQQGLLQGIPGLMGQGQGQGGMDAWLKLLQGLKAMQGQQGQQQAQLPTPPIPPDYQPPGQYTAEDMRQYQP